MNFRELFVSEGSPGSNTSCKLKGAWFGASPWQSGNIPISCEECVNWAMQQWEKGSKGAASMCVDGVPNTWFSFSIVSIFDCTDSDGILCISEFPNWKAFSKWSFQVDDCSSSWEELELGTCNYISHTTKSYQKQQSKSSLLTKVRHLHDQKVVDW